MNKGARISAIKSRQKALDEYYQSPNTCYHCGKVIRVHDGQKVSTVRKKKFCDRRCSFSANLLKYNTTKSHSIEPRKCISCGDTFQYVGRETLCPTCTKSRKLDYRTIGQSSHSTIRSHARDTMRRSGSFKICKHCGYTSFVEVCHIKPVSAFSKDALLKDVNALENLIYLCPNCHWEFDNL